MVKGEDGRTKRFMSLFSWLVGRSTVLWMIKERKNIKQLIS